MLLCKIGRLVLKCEDEILKTTKTLLNDKKVVCAKSNCLIHNISLVMICLLLSVVICIRSCFCYTRNCNKKECILLYQLKWIIQKRLILKIVFVRISVT